MEQLTTKAQHGPERIVYTMKTPNNGNGGNGGNENPVPEFKPLAAITGDLWAAACSAAGYPMDANNCPMVPVSGEQGDGFIVSVLPPVDIDMSNLVRALLQYALRTGQGGVKGKDAAGNEIVPTLALATESANAAMNGSYKPSRERSATDLMTKEADRRATERVTAGVRKQKPEASDDDIAASVKAWFDSDRGKARLVELRKEVMEDRTYKPSRKGTGKGTVIEVTDI